MGNILDSEEEEKDYDSYESEGEEEGEQAESSEEEQLEKRGKKIKEYSYKVVIVGKPESGKTAIVNRLINNTYTEAFSSENQDVRVKKIVINANTVIKLEIWDILPRVGYLTWFDGAAGAVVVYDCTMPSAMAVQKWKEELDQLNPLNHEQRGTKTGRTRKTEVELSESQHKRPFPIVLAAAKCDEPHEPDPLLEEFIKTAGFIGRFETSAKTNTGIKSAFEALVQQMHKNQLNASEPPLSPLLLRSPPMTRAPVSPPSPSPPSSSLGKIPPPTKLSPPASPFVASQPPSEVEKDEKTSPTIVHSVPEKVVHNLEKTAEDIYSL